MSYRALMALVTVTSAVIVVALGAYLLGGEEGFPSHRLSGPELAAFNGAVGAAFVAFPSQDKLEPTATPVTVLIPAIGVAAPVTRLGLKRDGTLKVPSGYSETGWWSGGPKPGQTGRAVIVGHVDSKSGPAVFANLQEVRRGDLVEVIRGDGSAVEFEVRGVDEADKLATSRPSTSTGRPTAGVASSHLWREVRPLEGPLRPERDCLASRV